MRGRSTFRSCGLSARLHATPNVQCLPQVTPATTTACLSSLESPTPVCVPSAGACLAMAFSDKALGAALLALAAIIFVYYSSWILLLVSRP
jgi:hypothetical protein